MKCFLGFSALFSLFSTVFCKFTDLIVTSSHRNGVFMIARQGRVLILNLHSDTLQVKAASQPIILMVCPRSWTTTEAPDPT